MVAKPIIDLDVVILCKNLETVIGILTNVGYEHQGDLGIKEREAFKQSNAELKNDLPPHHLYVCNVQNEKLHRHIAFREYLRAHPDEVKKAGYVAGNHKQVSFLFLQIQTLSGFSEYMMVICLLI